MFCVQYHWHFFSQYYCWLWNIQNLFSNVVNKQHIWDRSSYFFLAFLPYYSLNRYFVIERGFYLNFTCLVVRDNSVYVYLVDYRLPLQFFCFKASFGSFVHFNVRVQNLPLGLLSFGSLEILHKLFSLARVLVTVHFAIPVAKSQRHVHLFFAKNKPFFHSTPHMKGFPAS